MFKPVRSSAAVLHSPPPGGTMAMVRLACPPGLLSVCLSVCVKPAPQAAQCCCNAGCVEAAGLRLVRLVRLAGWQKNTACISRYLAEEAQLSRGQLRRAGRAGKVGPGAGTVLVRLVCR